MAITTAHRTRRDIAAPWLATLGRLVLGAVWIVAGALKLADPSASVRAVRAYELLPEAAAQIVGAGLPMVEVVLGVLLVVGLGTRACAVLSVLFMGAFVVGIASAWIRGLQIDCGCFGSGGQLGPGERPTYGWELLRDGSLTVLAALLAWRPQSKWSVDQWLLGPGPADGPAADAEEEDS